MALGQTWDVLWGPSPDHPYATLECSPHRAARWAREQRRITGETSAHRQWATSVAYERLDRELVLVAGDQVPVPPLWVLRAWVDAHFVCCEHPWARCLDAIVERAETEERAVRIIDLPELAYAGAAVRWAARRARPATLAPRRWHGEERTAWHEAGHALVAFQDQDRYDPLVVNLSRHLGGFDDGAVAFSPLVVPTNPVRGAALGGPGAQVPAGTGKGWSEEQKATYRVWLSAGMAAEQLFVPEMVPLGDSAPYGPQYPAQCNVLHLDEAMLRVAESAQQVRALTSYLLAHGGASRRHLKRMLGPWAVLEAWIES